MIVKAFAKINLSLNIIDKTEDNYHNLESVVLPLKLHDVIEVLPLKGDYIYDSIICDSFTLKATKYNLCAKAINYLRDKFHFKEYFQVIIHKDIFVQAGLGGGSSDAAAVIKCVQKILNLPINDELLAEMTGEIGCDVPFFLKNEPCVLTGLGEKLEPIQSKLKCYVLLVKPKEGLATIETFGAFDEKGVKSEPKSEQIKECLAENNLLGLKDLIKNDLQDVAEELVPDIKTIRESLVNDGFEIVQMTGSGSTVFALSTNKKMVKKAEKKYATLGYDTAITKLL